jgi:hypothetical protein
VHVASTWRIHIHHHAIEEVACGVRGGGYSCGVHAIPPRCSSRRSQVKLEEWQPTHSPILMPKEMYSLPGA